LTIQQLILTFPLADKKVKPDEVFDKFNNKNKTQRKNSYTLQHLPQSGFSVSDLIERVLLAGFRQAKGNSFLTNR